MKMTGAEMAVEILLEHNVDTIFGYPGGAALFIYDALYKYKDKIRHVLTAHEQGASHAADGYARSTGKTGVVLATSGPGATNLVTGIATAYMDSIPMVIITANVANSLIGRDAFQETCITGITFPVTKHSYFVNKTDELADALRNAFRIANEGRKGPVLVDITKEVMRLMEKADIPAVNSMMAAGAVPVTDNRSFGMLGMHGSYAANKCIAEADLVLAVGTRFSDRVALNPKKFASKAKILQIDIDKSEVSKNVIVNDAIVGDCREVLEELIPEIQSADHSEWIAQINRWNQEHPLKITGYDDVLNPQQIIQTVCDKAGEDAIYVTDVGQHQMWSAQYINHQKPRHFLTSGGLGTMGFGYGAAIGAQFGNPDKRVIHFTGDGSFHMNLNEACTAVSNNLPIITVIMNNSVLGMVYQWQTDFYGGRYSQTTPERKTDFVKLIEAFGGTGYRAETYDEFCQALDKAFKAEGPVWIDCRIVQNEKVLPMIPNGMTVDDSIFE